MSPCAKLTTLEEPYIKVRPEANQAYSIPSTNAEINNWANIVKKEEGSITIYLTIYLGHLGFG